MKGQFWSIDMIFAIVIFSGGIILLSIVWFGINSQFASSYSDTIGIMQTQLDSLVSRLQAPGSPADWNSAISISSPGTWENVSMGFGSSSDPGTMSLSKIFALEAMSSTSYQSTKQGLGIGFDYYITILSPGAYNISIGLSPFSNNATSIQTATVPVVLSTGQPASMRVIVWTNTTFGVG